MGADARLLSASNLRVQEAPLTGESEAVDKNPARLRPGVPVADRSNMVFRGTAVTSGVGRAVVTATGMDTEIGQIATSGGDGGRAHPAQVEIARVSGRWGCWWSSSPPW